MLEGNLRRINDAIRLMRPDVEIVLLLEPYGYGLRAKIGYLLRLVRGMYHVRTAGLVVVDNAWLPAHVAPHRSGTTVVQVWHAAGALKRFGMDTLPPPAEPERTFLHRYYDYVVTSGDASRGPWAAALRTPIDRVLPLGTPRTDPFFDLEAIAAARDRALHEYPTLRGRRVILYAPTFRGRGVDKRSDDQLDAARLRNQLAPGDALVLKSHPNLDPRRVPTEGYDVIARPSDDMYDLLALADVLVTDYSSCVFEFALLRRPIILVAGDLEAYEQDPGLYVDMRTDMVGALVTDTDGVAAAIARASVDEPPTTRSSPDILAAATAMPGSGLWSDSCPGRRAGDSSGAWRPPPPRRPWVGHTAPMATKIILDVDTGTDDAVALMVAALSPDIELVGATVVNGNTVLDSCVENTLRVVEWIGMPEMPVHRGMSRPLARPQADTGQPGDADPRRQAGPARGDDRRHGDQHAVDWLIDTYLASDGDITLVPVGPLTNIATAIQKEPRILEHIPEIVIMGGAHDHGNATASAEFNIWLDPEAARIVVNCGRPIRMVPLDATHRALVSTEDCADAARPGHAGRRGGGAVHQQAHRGLRRDPADAPGRGCARPRRAGRVRGHRPVGDHDALHPGGRGDRRRTVRRAGRCATSGSGAGKPANVALRDGRRRAEVRARC